VLRPSREVMFRDQRAIAMAVDRQLPAPTYSLGELLAHLPVSSRRFEGQTLGPDTLAGE
jgi:hypothetical protein